MMLTITAENFASLSPATQAELISRLKGSDIHLPSIAQAPAAIGSEFDDFDMEDVADLTFKQIKTWMEAASEWTKNGLRAIAEHGPIIDVSVLHKADVINISQFQSRTTIRTRTVTGDPSVRMLGSDDSWEKADTDGAGEYSSGRYAVTPITHQSLRRYFNID